MAVQPDLCQTWSETPDRFSHVAAQIMLPSVLQFGEWFYLTSTIFIQEDNYEDKNSLFGASEHNK